MILFANLIIAIGKLLGAVLYFFQMMVIVSAVLSWVSADPYNPLVRFINSSVDPLLRPIRRYIPSTFGRVDFSPLILLLVLLFLQGFLVQSILDVGMQLRMQALAP